MSELEEKLNALLSDPNSMAQVMQMAQQLSGAMGEQKAVSYTHLTLPTIA